MQDAWVALLSEPDGLLMDLITEETESLCGYRPDAEDVEDFLLVQLEKPPRPQTAQRERPSAPSRPEALQSVSEYKPPVSERRVSFEVFGSKREARNAIEALIEVLRAMSKRDPGLLPKLSQTVPTRSRNHIARAPELVYPNRPQLSGLTMELEPGWWLGTNIANRDKLRIIKKACEAGGWTFGAMFRLVCRMQIDTHSGSFSLTQSIMDWLMSSCSGSVANSR
jgi:predicted type IV restriction endonuclease